MAWKSKWLVPSGKVLLSVVIFFSGQLLSAFLAEMNRNKYSFPNYTSLYKKYQFPGNLILSAKSNCGHRPFLRNISTPLKRGTFPLSNCTIFNPMYSFFPIPNIKIQKFKNYRKNMTTDSNTFPLGTSHFFFHANLALEISWKSN